MSTDAATATTETDPYPWRFKPGYDARRDGSGRKPGVPQTPRTTRAARMKAAAEAAAAELAVLAEKQLREKFDAMTEAELAKYASRPAIEHLLAVVNDEAAKPELRVNAAAKLLTTGWAAAPTQINATVTNGNEPVINLSMDETRERLRAWAVQRGYLPPEAAAPAPVLPLVEQVEQER